LGTLTKDVETTIYIFPGRWSDHWYPYSSEANHW